MKTYFFTSLRITLVLLVLFSGIYTFIIYGAAQLLPGKGKGEMVRVNNKEYYANIGQLFTEDKYFHGRPSAGNYNASGSGGSNKGPYNKEYLGLVKARIDSFLLHNPTVQRADIPVELVTASGSGLDPDISPSAAMVQAGRIARARNIAPEVITGLIGKQIQKPVLGTMGPQKVNVLQLNLALDQINQLAENQ